ncbi:STY4526/YPO1902 family pathogenicity island replication protein [uncultured Cardiobacterium sp.]|uniref:STY4526/YPO1902 family pathogenicity island replication protein n=1 Tax=uncultured Cardiobacterium sp. TaxID=417619 RepID=UPI00261E430A|nr:STY4526/YPO1902 family pathogenicity island replication protein [uncultured Cardiobacterium sp.]
MQDFDYQIQAFILQQYSAAAANPRHHRYLQRKGFSAGMIVQLRRLSLDARQILVRSSPFEVRLSDVLKTRLGHLAARDEMEALVMTALRLGASRRMLHELLGLGEAEYNRLKTMAGVPKAERNRPQSLSLDMQDMLATIHNNLLNCYRRQGSEPHPLQLLIRMAETTNLELNRVYDGYYCKNYAGFSGDEDESGDDAEGGAQ